MKKFTNIDGKFENKKYSEPTKNDIYEIVKENIRFSIKGEKTNVELKGIEEIVEKLSAYVNNVKLTEKANTLIYIKSLATKGTLNMQHINEAIDDCRCSETCPNPEIYEDDDETPVAEFDPNFYEAEPGDEEIDVVKESYVQNFNYLVDEFIKIIESGASKATGWYQFFDRHGVPEGERTNMLVEHITREARIKKPNLF
jgi:hypothetical protein